MLGLPKSTEFNKRIPKQKFYENIAVTPAIKKAFVEQIRIIYWRNKIAATTLNLAAGEQVTEIEVIEIKLASPQINETALKQIDREIPYHILFVLSFDSKVQAWIGYKEAAGGGNKAFKVNKYYHTEWMSEEELHLSIDGLNMDPEWETLIIQVGKEEVGQGTSMDEHIMIEEPNPWMSRYRLMIKRRSCKRKSRNWKSRLGMRNSRIRSFGLHSRSKR